MAEERAVATPAAPPEVSAVLGSALVEERLRIVAGLIRLTRDWELAEDCVQDAAERALARWPRDGVPANPAAWLTTTAHRRALDVLRRRRVESGKLQEVVAMGDREAGPRPAGDVLIGPGGAVVDDRLVLLFTCCHPALPLAGRVALTGRTVAGLSTRQLASAFLVSEVTMGQRLLRSRQKIAHTGIGFTPPPPHRLTERTAGVLAVIYLLFNEGYVSSSGPADDVDLATQALELARLVSRLLPDDPEPSGLLALIELQHSRRAARVDPGGDLVPMEDQDRSLWDRSAIRAGLHALSRARERKGGDPGPYALQAEIAARHATAATAQETDWPTIVALYDRLLARHGSPVVALNRAVAVSFADGPEAGLAALETVAPDPRLTGYPLLPAVRADLLRRAGRTAEALGEYERAEAATRNDAERRFLARRRLELAADHGATATGGGGGG